MKVVRHTPGPWAVGTPSYSNYSYEIEARNERGALKPVARIASGFRLSREANARLIAAAPDLLESLMELTPPIPPKDAHCHAGICDQQDCRTCSRIIRAHAVIAKATEGKA